MKNYKDKGSTHLLYLFFIMLMLLSACSAKIDKTPSSFTDIASASKAATNAWNSFKVKLPDTPQEITAYIIKGSLRYANSKERGRLVFLLWSNGGRQQTENIRLDLLLSIGSLVGSALESEQGFDFFIPEYKTLYQSSSSQEAFDGLQIAIPFSLRNLSDIIMGNIRALFVSQEALMALESPNFFVDKEGNFLFFIPAARIPGYIKIDPIGNFLGWQEDIDSGWRMIFEPSAKKPFMPSKLRFSLAHSDYSALINIREAEYRKSPYPASQMRLEIPKGTQRKNFNNQELIQLSTQE